MAEGGIKPKEYRQWRSPKLALASLARALRIPDDDAKARLLEALATGAVSAACYKDFSRLPGLVGGEGEAEFIRIPRTAWAQIQSAETLWEKGNANFESFGNRHPFAVFEIPRECIGVRFEPVGLELLAEQLETVPVPVPQAPRAPRVQAPIKPLETSRGYNPRPVGTLEQIAPELAAFKHPTASPYALVDPAMESGGELTMGQVARYFATTHTDQPKRRINPVTTGEIKAWYRGLTRAEKSLGVPALWALAKRHHPDRHLPRKMVEPFGKDRSNGHRAILR